MEGPSDFVHAARLLQALAERGGGLTIRPAQSCLPVVFSLSHCSMSLSENLQTPVFLVVSLIAGMILLLAHLRMVSGLTCSRWATCFTVSFCDLLLFTLVRFVSNLFVWPESFGLP
jgi:hypothetical protein